VCITPRAPANTVTSPFVRDRSQDIARHCQVVCHGVFSQSASARRAVGRRSHDTLLTPAFLPRDAILARVLAVSLRLSVSVCLSQVGVLSKWMDGSSWFLARRLLSTCPTLFFEEIQVYPKIRVSSGNLSQTPDLENFASAYRSSKRVVDLARERWRRLGRDKLGRRRSTKLIIPPSSDARPL